MNMEGPTLLLLLLLAIVGAILDSEYKRRGGTKPTATHKRYFAVAAGLCLTVTVLAALYSPVAAADMTILFLVTLFALWEVGRWRVRRKYKSPDGRSPGRIDTGLRRLGVVLAMLVAAAMTYGGYLVVYPSHVSAAFIIGALVIDPLCGVVVVVTVMAFFRWIVRRFTCEVS